MAKYYLDDNGNLTTSKKKKKGTNYVLSDDGKKLTKAEENSSLNWRDDEEDIAPVKEQKEPDWGTVRQEAQTLKANADNARKGLNSKKGKAYTNQKKKADGAKATLTAYLAEYGVKSVDELEEKIASEALAKQQKIEQEFAEKVKERNKGKGNVDTSMTAPGGTSAGAYKKSDGKWVKAGAFEDGSDGFWDGVGDLASSVGSTVADAILGIFEGLASVPEGIVDLGAYAVADLGLVDDPEALRERAAEDFVGDVLLGDAHDAVKENSFLGDEADKATNVVGQMLPIIATGGLASAATGSTAAATAATTAVTATSSAGQGYTEAFQSGADTEDRWEYAGKKAAIDAGTELIAGGLGNASKAVGVGKGLGGVDDMIAKGASNTLTKGIKNQTAKTILGNTVEGTVKAAGEGGEELLAGYLTAHAKKSTYREDDDFDEILEDENLGEQFWLGTFGGAVATTPSVIGSSKRGTDYVTGLNANETKVVEKAIEKEIAKAEKDGKKLTQKEKNKIHEQVQTQLERGEIDIDTIEEVLGGESYETYNKEVERQKADLQELAEIYEGEELKEQINNYLAESKIGDTKNNLSKAVMDIVAQDSQKLMGKKNNGRGSYLAESYNQQAQRQIAFKADLSQVDEKYQGTYKKAIESGILNNTRKTHDFVDFVARISADKGVEFDFTNNEKIAQTSFAVEGKTVNGYVDGNTIGLNIDSKKALQKTVGHEVSHILEGTELFDTFQEAAFEYAKGKKATDSKFANEYVERLYNARQLYKNVEGYQGADGFKKIKKEVTADLVGDYIFTDEAFLRKLSTEHRNIFEKLWEEVKYLCKVATAGSSEARQLEQVKHLFDKVYSEGKTKTNNKAHSLSAEQDAEYLRNVDSWNKEAAQKMVDDAAKNAGAILDESGKPLKLYRGTQGGQTVFAKESTLNGKIYTIDNINVASKYGDKSGKATEIEYQTKGEKTTYALYGFPKNMLTIDAQYGVWSDLVIPEELRKYADGRYKATNAEIAEWAEQEGYDALRIDNVRDGSFDAGSEIIFFDENLVKSADAITKDNGGNTIPLSQRFNEGENDIRYSLSEDSQGNKLSPAVQKRFANSKVVDEDGDLKVVYHGTYAGEFSIFDKAKGSVEGDFGSGFYFTDNEYDVETNYEDGGADFENKVARRAEQIEAEEDIEYGEAEKRAREELYKGGHKFSVYLNMENPAIVGETILFDPEKYYEEYNRDDYDSDEDYEGDVEQLVYDDIDQILWDVERNVELYDRAGLEEVLWNAVNEGGIGIEELKTTINNLYLEDADGNLVGNEVTRQIIESLGYDGIIDNTVSTKFNMDMESGTTHYIVFKPNQIKSIDNQNPTDNPDINLSLSQQGEHPIKQTNLTYGEDLKLDNSNGLVYNGKRGDGYVKTDEFRNLQAECQRMSYEDTQLYWAGNKQIDDGLRGRFSRGIKQIFLESRNNGRSNDSRLLEFTAKGNQYKIYDNVDSSLFHDVFEMARKHLRNGELVDLHEVETTEDHGVGYKYCKNYLSEDGLSGFSITPDGDLISVFNASGKSGFLRAIAPYVKENAKTLDCYASPKQNLQGMYETIFGFKTASVMDYNMEYDHDNIAENHNMPNVAFMVNTESDVETKTFAKEQYDEAVEYRNSFVNQATENEVAFFVPEDIAPMPAEHSITDTLVETAPLPDEQLEDGTYAAIKPKRTKASESIEAPIVDDAPMVENDAQPEKIAKVLTEIPQAPKQKGETVDKIVRNFVDKGAEIENISLETGNRELQAKYSAIKRADSKAQYFMENGAEGVKPLKEIITEVEQSGQVEDFYNYLYHKHNVARMSLEAKERPNLKRLEGEMAKRKLLNLQENQLRAIASEKITKETSPKRVDVIKTVREYLASKDVKNKPVFGYSVTAEKSQNIASQYELNNPKFVEYANDIYNNMNYLRSELVENGVISQETADLWAEVYPYYVPIHRADANGNAINVALDTNKTGINAPIKRATGGNSDILPLFNTLAERTLQTYKAIAKNKFGVELKNTLGSAVETSTTNLDDVIESIDTQDSLLQEGKDGKNPTFTVFENGERVTFDITKGIYEAMKPTSEGLAYTNPLLNKASSWHKKVLTEYNLFFAARNAIKDSQDVFINSQHAAKTYANMPQAVKELLTGKGKYVQEYWENGGADNTYFDKSNNTFADADKGTVKKVIGIPFEAISKVNNFVEAVPRLAEYIASRKKGKSIEGAMLDAARVTTDFSAGGDVTKLLNRNGATFLNASVQGAAQQVRNIREAKANGFKGIMKLASKYALAGLPATILNSLLWDDDEEYEELSDYVKDNYYIVAKYGDGQFVRIPKGRTVSVIQEIFEQIGNTASGEETDWGNVFTLASSNLAPNNPLDNNVIAPLVQAANNTTWYGDDLVPTRLQDVPVEEQYDETIDSISKWLGENTGISPYKINYVIDQYSGVVGDMFLPMLTPEAERGDSSFAGNMIAPLADEFTVDSTIKNQNVTDFYSKADELKVNANGSMATDEDILMSKYMSAINSELGELYQLKREIQNSNLTDEEKYNQVRDIQKQINSIAENGLNSYSNVNIDGNYATVNDKHYKLNDEGEWTKIDDETIEKNMPFAKTIGGYSNYLIYSSDLNAIKADKDENGKSINGSRQEKVLDYINSLNADYTTKIILYKKEYPSDDTYNNEIIEAINSNNDLTYEERVAIYTQLGFTVKDGYVYW